MRLSLNGLFLVSFCFYAAQPVWAKGEAIPYRYGSREEVPRYFSFVTDNPKFNRMWTETVVEILSRQLENGQLIESSSKSGIYPNTFPRNLAPVILAKCGYDAEVRKYLDFMWENQKADGSFWNYHDRQGTGTGKIEEDGGCYVVGHTCVYALYSGDVDYLKQRWGGIRKAMDFLEDHFSKDVNLVYATAGYSEGNIKGGYDIYQQALSIYAFRSAARIAGLIGREGDADRWSEYARKIRAGIYENLYNQEAGRFVFQKRPDGTFFDPPYPGFLVLSYYDVIEPDEKGLDRSFAYLVGGPRYGEVSDEIFGLEPFDHAHPTGRGFWIGQNGHGWVIPYLLKAGRLEEADRWFRSLIACTDNKTFLVPEHINWSFWDADGGEWAGKRYGLFPDSTAWVDPGNLLALSTAMHMVFTIVETDPGDEDQRLYFRVPSSLGAVAVSNLKGRGGYIDATFVRVGDGIELSLSGAGKGEIVVVGVAKDVRVKKDGLPYEGWRWDAPGSLHIQTDFHPHRFTIRQE